MLLFESKVIDLTLNLFSNQPGEDHPEHRDVRQNQVAPCGDCREKPTARQSWYVTWSACSENLSLLKIEIPAKHLLSA